jgi:hypothetical protein
LGGRAHALLKLPAAQRKGAGAAGLIWGLQQADELGLPAYLEASGMGRPLYAKHGFNEVSAMDQVWTRVARADAGIVRCVSCHWIPASMAILTSARIGACSGLQKYGRSVNKDTVFGVAPNVQRDDGPCANMFCVHMQQLRDPVSYCTVGWRNGCRSVADGSQKSTRYFLACRTPARLRARLARFCNYSLT